MKYFLLLILFVGFEAYADKFEYLEMSYLKTKKDGITEDGYILSIKGNYKGEYLFIGLILDSEWRVEEYRAKTFQLAFKKGLGVDLPIETINLFKVTGLEILDFANILGGKGYEAVNKESDKESGLLEKWTFKRKLDQ